MECGGMTPLWIIIIHEIFKNFMNNMGFVLMRML